MKTELKANEQIKADARANLQRGPEAVGGHLYLTNLRLIFEPHVFNVQKGAVTIDLANVVAVEPAWTKLLNLIPVLPNALKVSVNNGKDHRFLVSDRSEWATHISAAVTEYSAG